MARWYMSTLDKHSQVRYIAPMELKDRIALVQEFITRCYPEFARADTRVWTHGDRAIQLHDFLPIVKIYANRADYVGIKIMEL
jgi:hypothetical protein